MTYPITRYNHQLYITTQNQEKLLQLKQEYESLRTFVRTHLDKPWSAATRMNQINTRFSLIKSLNETIQDSTYYFSIHHTQEHPLAATTTQNSQIPSDEPIDLEYLHLIPHKTTPATLEPIQPSILDTLHLDLPLLNTSIKPKNSLECRAFNLRLQLSARRIKDAVQYVLYPVWIYQQDPSTPRYLPSKTLEFMHHHANCGNLKLTPMKDQGSFSIIYEGVFKQEPIVLKCPLKDKPLSHGYLVNEIKLLMSLPKTIKTILLPEAISNLGMFLPKADTTLFDLLNSEYPLQPHEIKLLFLRVADALNTLHKGGFTHKDVKPENILIKDNNSYLSDFGATKPTANDSVLSGSYNYAAPEVVQGGSYLTTAIDVWSFGVCLIMAITKTMPKFIDIDQLENPKVSQHEKAKLILQFLKTHQTTCPEDFIQVIKSSPFIKIRDPKEKFLAICISCLHGKPDQRPSMAKIITDLIHSYESPHL
ncbi:MAG: protein kinase [Chlamydiota bacterium]